MVVVNLHLDEEEYNQLKFLAQKKGYNSVDEFIKSLIKKGVLYKNLPEIFYQGASKKVKVEKLDREKIYDRI